MKYIVKYTNQFKKEYKTLKRRGYDVAKLHAIVDILANGKILPTFT